MNERNCYLSIYGPITTAQTPRTNNGCEGYNSRLYRRVVIIYRRSLCFSELKIEFKRGSSTAQCTFSMFDIIDYYNVNNYSVKVLKLDVSKAFDGVKYCKNVDHQY